MKIECPDCKLSGEIDDARVPATGLAMNCPRCKKHFTVERLSPDAGAVAAMLDTCPVCQYATFSEEKFSVCPKCGLVVAEHQQQQLAYRQNRKSRSAPSAGASQMQQQNAAPLPRLSVEEQRREEESRRKYGLDTVPGGVESAAASVMSRSAADTPLPITIAGWGTILAAVLLLVFGGSGIMEYLQKAKAAQAALAALEEAPTGTALVAEFLLFPALLILFAVVLLLFGAQFLALKRWSINGLQKGAWTGISLLALMKLADILFWFRRASADASLSYYAMGIVGDLLLMALYVVPFFALAEYLKSPLFEKCEDLFS